MLSFSALPAMLVVRRYDAYRCNTTRRRYRTSARLISLPTGLDMEVIEVPQQHQPTPSDKPPLVFVHGSLHAAWCFRLFQPFFAEHGFQTFAVSLRGAAGSVIDQVSAPTIEEHIADLSALLANLNLPKPPVIVAHSMGGFITQKWIELDPSFNASALVLLASTPPTANSRIVRRTIFRRGIGTSLRITLAFIRRTVGTDLELCREIFFSRKDSEGFSEELEGDEKLLQYMELFRLSRTLLGNKSRNKFVKGTGTSDLQGKVLVIGGLLDPLVDREALEETAEFWRATLCLVEDGPHELMLYSKWKDIANTILGWINKDSIHAGQFTAADLRSH